jgi:O-methyltransferase
MHTWNTEIEVAQFMASLIKMTGAKSVLECGTFQGYTSATLIKALNKGSYFVSIDIEDHRLEENKAVFEQAAKSGVVTEFINKSSLDALKDFKGFKFDLVFLDTFHHWSHILTEFKLAELVVDKEGFIAVHDTIHIEDEKRLMDYAQHFGYQRIDFKTPDNRGLTLLQRK